MNGLFHKKIGLPANYRHPMAVVPVRWTFHAIKAANSDRYGNVQITDRIDLTKFETVEVEIVAGRIAKILVRGAYSDNLDVTYALIPQLGKEWVVKTTWLNWWNDDHRLISRSKYVGG